MKTKKNKGFFTLPEHIKGGVEHGKRKHITFYFDKDSDFDKVVGFFCADTIYKDVPMPSTGKLMDLLPSMVKKKRKKKGK